MHKIFSVVVFVSLFFSLLSFAPQVLADSCTTPVLQCSAVGKGTGTYTCSGTTAADGSCTEGISCNYSTCSDPNASGCGSPQFDYFECTGKGVGHSVNVDSCGNFTNNSDSSLSQCANYNGPAVALGPNPAGAKQLQETLLRITNLVIEIGFIASLFMSVWGGFRYLTSGGETKSVENANQIITWALVGIVFMVVAFLVLRVVGALTGVDVTGFCLGFPGGPNTCANP